MKAIGFIVAGIVMGAVLFVLGAMDDAPGLCLIGCTIAFLMMMRGLYHAKVIQRGYGMPIVLLAFGLLGTVFPSVLYLDHEIESLSIVMVVSAIGVAMIMTAVIKMQNVKRINDNR